jgi:uncharacterized repeat protein (TIGR01451 family)
VRRFSIRWGWSRVLLVVLFACGGLPISAHASGTAAGTSIQNTAQVSYDIGGNTITAASNATTLTVAEIVNFNVTTLTSSVSVTPGANNQALMYRLTNTGNGPEKFHLVPNSAMVGDDFDPLLAGTSIYFDTDGTTGLSAGDTAYVAGSNDPNLAPDASVVVLVVNNIPAGLANGANGKSELTATAFTGTGAAGTIFAGQGASGTDAVLGTSGGRANSSCVYVAGAITLNAVKSQLIADPFGGSQPVPGAAIAYQIVITPTGTGTANAATFTDAIPANTSYVANSLKLNNAALSDSADGDAGQYLSLPSAQVRVALGNLTQASGAQTVSFKVTIN